MRFRLKITLCMLGLLGLLFGVGGSLLTTVSFQASLARERQSAYAAYQTVLGTLQLVNELSGQLDYEGLAGTLEQLSAQNGDSWASLRLYGDGAVIYEEGGSGTAALSEIIHVRLYGDGTAAYEEAASATSEQAQAGYCVIEYAAPESGGRLLILSGTLEAAGQTLYLDMTRDISAVFQARQTQERVYQGVFLLMAALCALLSFAMSHLLTRPLASLSQASQGISAGDLSCRAAVRSQDEVGLVARDFNAMAETLEANILALRAAMDRQERFMGAFAHELKTPMTSIIGYADLVRGQTLTEEERQTAANYIVTEGQRLERLSRKLLELLALKGEGAALVPACPAELIQGLAAHLGPVYEAQGVGLVCDCQEGTCLLEPELVKALLVNLWDNARKAAEGQPEPGRICTTSQMLPDGCVISVRDNGRGIPPDALEHLTEAFYRVDKARSRAQGGVGLGLALCREIAAAHHGEIRFESREGQGTTVTVTLRGGRP